MNETTIVFEEFHGAIISSLPEFWRPIVLLAIFTIILSLYIVFVWKFYHFLAKEDILDLNLSKYNTTGHPVLHKFLASLFFLLEYIIILPILSFFWFGTLALFLLFLSRNLQISQILLVSSAIVAATRVAAYYKEGPAKELAKIFPLTILATSITDPSFFLIDELIGRFSAIPSLFNQILVYLIFIAIVEILLRGIYIFIDFITSEEEREMEEITKDVPASE